MNWDRSPTKLQEAICVLEKVVFITVDPCQVEMATGPLYTALFNHEM